MTEREKLELEYEYLQLKKKKAMANKTPLLNPVGEVIATIASGGVAGPLSGYVGAVGAALPGPEGQGAEWQRKTQEALTYQPRSGIAQQAMSTISKPFEWLANKADQAGGAVTDDTGSPTLGAATNAVIQAAPSVAGLALKVPLRKAIEKAKVEGAVTASQNSVKDATFKAAREEGYGVPKSIYNPSFVSNQIESMGGKAAVKQDFSLKNQKVTNKIARKEAGLTKDSPISEDALEAARYAMAKPYREIAAVSPRAKSALEKLQETRAEAKRQWVFYRKQGDPKTYQEAVKLDQRASVYEKLIDAEAKRFGKPDLVKELREARVKIAKNHVVDRALNESDGNVDAIAIGQMRKKDAGLTDGLKTIGEFARAFPDVARPEAKVPAPGVSKLDMAVAGLVSGGGFLAGGPLGLAAGTIPLAASPIARVAARRGQGPRQYGPGAGLHAAHGIAGVTPLIGASGMPKRQ